MLSLSLSLLFLTIGKVIGEELRINSVNKFINFANSVNTNNVNYLGTTVFLDSDLDFSGKTFAPIGINNTQFFQGSFDGQGHIISGLTINSTFMYTGIFGCSRDLTVKNVVIDGSCSITSFSGSENAFVGGVIGECITNDDLCGIENSVSMASVTFNGNVSEYSLYLGGIAGYLKSSGGTVVKNCANYGTVAHSGVSKSSYFGGIIGSFEGGSSSKSLSIQNCLNYGKVAHDGTSKLTLFIGGLSGYSNFNLIDNCVSAGTITSNNEEYIGSIIGTGSKSSLTYCYWDEAIPYDASGFGTLDFSSNNLKFNDSFVLNETISIGSYSGSSLIEALNTAADHYALRDYSKWGLNKNKNSVAFKINNYKGFTVNYQILLLPNLASEGKLWFDGWYNDDAYSSSFTKQEIDTNTDLFGKWEENTNSYTISFETRGGTPVEPITAQYLSVEALPNSSTRNDCVFSFWETVCEERVDWNFIVPAYNITLYAVWMCTRITNADDLIGFSKVINSGLTSYSGTTTVLLDSDLDFAGKALDPIGKDNQNYFIGTFDGQGHIISNLKMHSSSDHVGLFGYSKGLTARNVVIDNSCSFEKLYSANIIFAGGVIGECVTNDGPCSIENSVNMASVTLCKTINNIRLGGIAGYLRVSLKHFSSVKNCVNYGAVSYTGSSGQSGMGGLIGYSYGHSSTERIYIQNCLNHGKIVHDSNNLYVGGISGYSSYASIENCVSAGELVSNLQSSWIGSISAFSSNTNIIHCFWSSKIGYNASGSGTQTTVNETSQATFDLDLVNKLNSYYPEGNSWSRWVLNSGDGSVSFKIENTKGFTVKSQIILLPDLADNSERIFSGWFTDEMLTSPFASSEVQTGTTLYGAFCGTSNYTVTLDVNDGSVSPILLAHPMVAVCSGLYGNLPNPTKEGFTFLGWFTMRDGGDKVESGDSVTNLNNHTLYAHWDVNKYTVTFNFDNGSRPEVRIIEFNTTIEYPSIPSREGYTFNGWDLIASFVPANDLNITAQWTERPIEFVEIVFSKKDMSEEEVKEIIESYTNDEGFIIEDLVIDSATGETRAVIKFTDPRKSEEFVRNINENKRPEGTSIIKRANGIVQEGSFSVTLLPINLFSVAIL